MGWSQEPAHATVFFICSGKYPSRKTNKNNWYFLFCVQSEILILEHVHVPIRDRISGREWNPVASPRLGRAWSLWYPPVRTVRAVSSPHRSPFPRSSSNQTKHSHLAKPNIVSYPNQTLHTQTINITNAAICTALEENCDRYLNPFFFGKNLRNFLFLRICIQSLQIARHNQ